MEDAVLMQRKSQLDAHVRQNADKFAQIDSTIKGLIGHKEDAMSTKDEVTVHNHAAEQAGLLPAMLMASRSNTSVRA